MRFCCAWPPRRPSRFRPSLSPTGPSTTAVAATDRARSLHVEGARLFELGKYDEAYVAFLAAWALKKHPQIAGNLADCEVKIGKYRDAAEHFAFMARDPNHEAKPEAKRLAQERLKDVQTKIGTLAISVSLNGAELMLDGKALGISPLEGPIFVEPGAHVVEATLKGYKPARMPVDAPEGVDAERGAHARGGVRRAAVPPGATTEPRRLSVPVIVAGSAVTVAALAVGGVFLGVAHAKANDAGTQSQQMRASGVTCASPPAAGACTSLHDLTVGSDTLHNVGVPLLGVGVRSAWGPWCMRCCRDRRLRRCA